jgi:hypothetical protein
MGARTGAVICTVLTVLSRSCRDRAAVTPCLWVCLHVRIPRSDDIGPGGHPVNNPTLCIRDAGVAGSNPASPTNEAQVSRGQGPGRPRPGASVAMLSPSPLASPTRIAGANRSPPCRLRPGQPRWLRAPRRPMSGGGLRSPSGSPRSSTPRSQDQLGCGSPAQFVESDTGHACLRGRGLPPAAPVVRIGQVTATRCGEHGGVGIGASQSGPCQVVRQDVHQCLGHGQCTNHRHRPSGVRGSTEIVTWSRPEAPDGISREDRPLAPVRRHNHLVQALTLEVPA